MDRRKIRRQEVRKIDMGSFQNPSNNYFNFKDLQIKSSTAGGDNQGKIEKHFHFSLTQTNLKIKKAHAITLKDYFSAQKEAIYESYNPKKIVKTPKEERVIKTSNTIRLERYKKTEGMMNVKLANSFYLQNTNPKQILQQIIKISEDCANQNADHSKIRQTFYNIGRDSSSNDYGQKINSLHPYKLFSPKPNDKEDVFPSERNQNVEEILGDTQVIKKTENINHSITKEAQNLRDNSNSPNFKQTINISMFNGKISHSRSNDNIYFRRGDSISRQSRKGDDSSNDQCFLQVKPTNMKEQSIKEIDHRKKFQILRNSGFQNNCNVSKNHLEINQQKQVQTASNLILRSLPSKYKEDMLDLKQIQTELPKRYQLEVTNNKLTFGFKQRKYKLFREIDLIHQQTQQLSSRQDGNKNCKRNSKSPLSEPSNKALYPLNIGSHRLGIVSNKLARDQQKIEQQISKTQARLHRLNCLHLTMSAKDKQKLNQKMHQVFNKLVNHSNSDNILNSCQSYSKNFPNQIRFYRKENDNNHKGNVSNNKNLSCSSMKVSYEEENLNFNGTVIKMLSNSSQQKTFQGQFQFCLQFLLILMFELEIGEIGKTSELMMSVLIDNFSVLNRNKLALRNRILLAIGLNPQNETEKVSKDQFELFYSVLQANSCPNNKAIEFIMKLDEEQEDREVEQSYHSLLQKDEFKRILRLITISIDERKNQGEKSVFECMLENLTLTEVIIPDENFVDLKRFRTALVEGKINPIDIIELIRNLY